MRFAGIKCVEEANKFFTTYLPKYNRKFKNQAASDAHLHRTAPHSRKLYRILSIREKRTVRNGFTFAHNGTLYQIEQATRAKNVIVEERLDGTLHITYKGQGLRFRKIRRPAKDSAEAPLLVHEYHGFLQPIIHGKRASIKVKKAGTAYRCSF